MKYRSTFVINVVSLSSSMDGWYVVICVLLFHPSVENLHMRSTDWAITN